MCVHTYIDALSTLLSSAHQLFLHGAVFSPQPVGLHDPPPVFLIIRISDVMSGQLGGRPMAGHAVVSVCRGMSAHNSWSEPEFVTVVDWQRGQSRVL